MKKIGNVIITIGLLLMAAALSLTLYNIWEDKRAGDASAVVVEELMEVIPEETQVKGTRSFSKRRMISEELEEEIEVALLLDESVPDMPVTEIDGNYYIGVLEIPTYGMSLPVMSDWDYDKLRIAPCCFSGSYYLDDLVIAGHNYSAHFSPLHGIAMGTKVNFRDAQGNVHTYEVVDMQVLSPTDVDILTQKSEDWDLSLFTCTTGGSSRYVIRCRRI